MSSPFSVNFDHEFQYRSVPGDDSSRIFPAISVGLIGPVGSVDLVPVIDTGATYSLFSGLRARLIGLDLAAGEKINLVSVSGSMPARLHQVTLEIFGSLIPCEVAFSEFPIRRELLGRHDLFSRVRFAFCEGLSVGYFHPQP